MRNCPRCIKGRFYTTCPVCRGKKYYEIKGNGTLRKCRTCKGIGTVGFACTKCGGSGKVK